MLFLETFSRFLGVLGTDHEKLIFYNSKHRDAIMARIRTEEEKEAARQAAKQAKKISGFGKQEEKRPDT